MVAVVIRRDPPSGDGPQGLHQAGERPFRLYVLDVLEGEAPIPEPKIH
jgi:hypothetical protein